MRRVATVVLITAALGVAPVAAAFAESQTVDGVSDISRMTVNNDVHAVKIKLVGPGAPCDGAHYIHSYVRSAQDDEYMVDAGCYPGSEWGVSLQYSSDGNWNTHSRGIDCAGLDVGYNDVHEFWRIAIPRTCLHHSPDRIRVQSRAQNYANASGVEGKATSRLLHRG
jgi:hypothetical protein